MEATVLLECVGEKEKRRSNPSWHDLKTVDYGKSGNGEMDFNILL